MFLGRKKKKKAHFYVTFPNGAYLDLFVKSSPLPDFCALGECLLSPKNPEYWPFQSSDNSEARQH